jgi:hypothetical protein
MLQTGWHKHNTLKTQVGTDLVLAHKFTPQVSVILPHIFFVITNI